MSETQETWLQESKRQASLGHYLNQLHAAEQALAAGGERTDECLYYKVEALVFLARYEEARAVRVSSEASPLIRARVGYMLGYAVLLSGQPEDALQQWQQYGPQLLAIGEPSDQFIVHIGHSRILQALDRPVDAIEAADRAFVHALLPGQQATLHYHLGYLWTHCAVHDRAILSFQQALRQDGISDARRASIHIGASASYRELGDLEQAESHARQAVRLHDLGGRTYRNAQARMALAETLHARGDTQNAISAARSALPLFKNASSTVGEMQGRLCLGQLLRPTHPIESERELRLVLQEPSASVHHAAAWLALAKSATDANDPIVTELIRFLGNNELRPPQRVEATHLLATLHRGEEAVHWYERWGRAMQALGKLEARSRIRSTQIQDQIAALRMETTLRKAAQEAEAERRDLMDLVAHDLRNPLSALLLMLDAIEEAEDHDEVLELVSMGQRAAGSLRDILDEALHASSSIGELGELAPVTFNAVARDAVDAFAGGARAKRQTLSCTLAGATQVQGVKPLLRSVCDNLISNALKFSPRGSTIHVELSNAGGLARLAVTDNGPGLSLAETASVFKRRVRGKAKPTDGESSTGLGLYLVRKVVEAHGGRVGATSGGPGCGSTFWVELSSEDQAEGSVVR